MIDILGSRGCSRVVDVLDLRGGSLVAKTVDAGACSLEEMETPVISN